MAKVIIRTGKVVLAVIIPLVILGVIMFGTDVFSVASAEPQGVDSTIDPQLQQMQDAAKMYTENKQYDLAELSYYDIIAAFPGTKYAMDAQSRLARCYIQERDKTNAQAAIETLLADYSDHPDIVKVIGRLADSCRGGKADRAFSIQLYQYIVNTYPSHERAMEAQSRLAICYIRQNKDSEAKAAVEKLLTDYSDHKNIVEAIAEVAKRYRKEKGNKAVPTELYQHVISNYPSHNWAVRAQSGLIKCYLHNKEDSNAQAAIEKLLADYSNHPDIVEILVDLADYCSKKKKNDIAIELSQYIVSEYPSHDLAVQAQSDLVKYYLRKEDKHTAWALVKKFRADYFDHPDIVEILVDLADYCRKDRAHKIAIGLYQHILSNYPLHNLVVQAQAGLVKYYIQRKDDVNTQAAKEAAQAAIETLLTDYSDHPDIANVISGVAGYCSYKNDTDTAIELYQHIASEYPSHKNPMWVQPRLIKNYIDQKDYINAQAAIDKLLTDYSDHPDIVKVIGGIADDCRKKKADDIAIELYQYIISEHPSHDLAIRSQSDLAKCYIQENDDAKAQAAIDKLLTDYSDHPAIAQVIWYLAGDCRKKNVDKAIELYRYIINAYPSHDLAAQAQSDLIKCYIQKNDYTMALSCIDRATQDYPDHKDIGWLLNAKADCYFNMGAENQVGEVVDEIFQSRLTKGGKYGILRDIAISYREHGNYERSLNLCQRVLANDPGKWERLRAYTGIAKSYIGLGDDAKVNETLDIICTDFADHEKLARAILVIGEDYYYQAREMKKQGLREAAKEMYLKAKNVWEKVEVEVESPDEHTASVRIYFLGICSHNVGDTSKAIEYLQKVVKYYPTSKCALGARFYIPQYAQALKKDPARAEEADELIETGLKDFVEKYPNSVYFKGCLRKLGVFYFHKAQHAQALDCFEQLIEKDDKELGRVVNMMSICYEKLGSPETAEEIIATYRSNL